MNSVDGTELPAGQEHTLTFDLEIHIFTSQVEEEGITRSLMLATD